jgi:hypothetical protein
MIGIALNAQIVRVRIVIPMMSCVVLHLPLAPTIKTGLALLVRQWLIGITQNAQTAYVTIPMPMISCVVSPWPSAPITGTKTALLA